MSRLVMLSALSALVCPLEAIGWHGAGHELAARSAVAAATSMPDFFRESADTVAHHSIDPDLFTRPIAAGRLHDSEAPEHYFDMELVAGVDLPGGRYEFLELLYCKQLRAGQVGLLPYAIQDATNRLAVVLAEHRRWPADPAIRAKCLYHAGVLAHYAADLCQPLHTTVHYDGRVVGGKSPRSGIHNKVDALLGKLPGGVAAGQRVRAGVVQDVLGATLDELNRSHALVDCVYELEKELPGYEEPLRPDSPAFAFARERLEAAARFTASLYLTAWARSAEISLPEWHMRPSVSPDRINK